MNEERTALGNQVAVASPLGTSLDRTAQGDHAHSQTPKILSFLKAAWRGWLKFAHILGTIQMVVVLSLIYYTMVAIMAIPFKLLADPLTLKRTNRGKWIEREPVSHTLDTMKNQY